MIYTLKAKCPLILAVLATSRNSILGKYRKSDKKDVVRDIIRASRIDSKQLSQFCKYDVEASAERCAEIILNDRPKFFASTEPSSVLTTFPRHKLSHYYNHQVYSKSATIGHHHLHVSQ